MGVDEDNGVCGDVPRNSLLYEGDSTFRLLLLSVLRVGLHC
jgi:hypothetical protein